MPVTAIKFWLAVCLVLLLGHVCLSVGMLNHRISRKGLLLEWWLRRLTVLTNPADFTETGQIYRRWAIRFEVALGIWMFLIVFILAAAPRGYGPRLVASVMSGPGLPCRLL